MQYRVVSQTLSRSRSMCNLMLRDVRTALGGRLNAASTSASKNWKSNARTSIGIKNILRVILRDDSSIRMLRSQQKKKTISPRRMCSIVFQCVRLYRFGFCRATQPKNIIKASLAWRLDAGWRCLCTDLCHLIM